MTAAAYFRELLPCSAMQLLETGARDALGHEFDEVSAVTTSKLFAGLDSPPCHHIHIGVRSTYFKHDNHAANPHLILWAAVEPVLPFDRRVVDENIPNESQQQGSRQRPLALFLLDCRKARQ